MKDSKKDRSQRGAMKNEDLGKSAIFLNAKKGDRSAFDELFSGHAASLQLYIRYRMGKKLRGAMESMDLVQEVYLHAFQGFSGFHGRSNGELYRWFCGIANHRLSDQRRKLDAIKRGGKAKMEIELDSSLGPPVDRAIAAKPGPRTIAALREDGARMEDAFGELSERDQEVIGLRQFEGLSSKETGERMGLEESAVNVLYFRAMGRWRETLERRGKKP